MHELSIALSLVETITGKVLGERPARVVGLALAIGELSGVDPAALRFAFPEATAGTPLEGARLEIEEVGLAAFCETCQVETPIPSPQRLRCPTCKTPTPTLLRGRELEILSVEIEEVAALR